MEPPIRTLLQERRILLVTGKGGVGRTTVAAALAHAAARLGRKVLLAEFEEPAHFHSSALAACFGRNLFPGEPTAVAPGVWGITLQSELGTEIFLTSLFRVPALARLALRLPALRRMLHAGPSFHELGLLYHMLHHIQATRFDGSPTWDLLILDMPATGHTLALTGLPTILLRLVQRGPIADLLRVGQRIFQDPRQASACVVTLPEPLPVSECLDLLEGLQMTSIPVGVVVANRVPQDPFTLEERGALDQMLAGQVPLGLSQVDRIRRADSSLGRLRASIQVPLVAVGEVQGSDVVGPVSRQLLGEAT